jgi:hypothetical protein
MRLSVVGALFLKKRGRRALSLLPVVVSLASSKRREVPSFLRLQNVVVVNKEEWRIFFFLPQSDLKEGDF